MLLFAALLELDALERAMSRPPFRTKPAEARGKRDASRKMFVTTNCRAMRRQPTGCPSRSPRALAVITVGLCAIFVAPLALARPASAQGGVIVTNYTDPSIDSPVAITVGPDGSLWFTNLSTNSIGRITTSGVVTNFTDPSIKAPWDIAAGSDGALWFTNGSDNSIGRITTSGVVTSYSDPSISSPYAITAGPDGALWFTNLGNNSVGRVTTSGAVTNYTDPSIDDPGSITAGPDGALWFTNNAGNSIGRITTSGAVTKYTDPSISDPQGISAGSDGALWFTKGTTASIGRITTSGTVTSYSDASSGGAEGITSGPDGALWFAAGGSIGRITTSGVATNYTDSSISGATAGITAGPDGALWFCNLSSNSIGRITTPGTAPPPVVSEVNPTTGYTSGATSVTVSGTGFTGATAVYFGARLGKKLDVTSDRTLKVVSPAGSAGAVDITVVTPAGTSRVNPADQFTYTVHQTPTVVSCDPSCGATVTSPDPTTVTASGSSGTSSGSMSIVLNTGQLSCGASYDYPVPITTLSTTDFDPGSNINVADTVDGIRSTSGVHVCYAAGSAKSGSFLAACNASDSNAPCLTSLTESDDSVTADFLAPAGDPRFWVGSGTATLNSFTPTKGDAQTEVTVKGTNLINVQAVTIGGAPARIDSASKSKLVLTVSVQAVPGTGVITANSASGEAVTKKAFKVT
jgi:streptogramin lyase